MLGNFKMAITHHVPMRLHLHNVPGSNHEGNVVKGEVVQRKTTREEMPAKGGKHPPLPSTAVSSTSDSTKRQVRKMALILVLLGRKDAQTVRQRKPVTLGNNLSQRGRERQQMEKPHMTSFMLRAIAHGLRVHLRLRLWRCFLKNSRERHCLTCLHMHPMSRKMETIHPMHPRKLSAWAGTTGLAGSKAWKVLENMWHARSQGSLSEG